MEYPAENNGQEQPDAASLVIVENLRKQPMLLYPNPLSQHSLAQAAAAAAAAQLKRIQKEKARGTNNINTGSLNAVHPKVNNLKGPAAIPTSTTVPNRPSPSAAPSKAISMANIIIRQDPGSRFRPGQSNIGYSFLNEERKIEEPSPQDEYNSWMGFFTNEAIADLTRDVSEPEFVPHEPPKLQDSQAMTPQKVTGPVDQTSSNALDLQMDLTSDGFLGFAQDITLRGPLLDDEEEASSRTSAQTPQPFTSDFIEPFNTPADAILYLANIAGPNDTAAHSGQILQMERGLETPSGQDIPQSSQVPSTPAPKHVASTTISLASNEGDTGHEN
ncbi:hypothetical protein CORC01_04785 [Colletotrichum orchidophilum]|uniref:Uncharacterized protein n=1 Tax=Colletotrichum orchidophilum TaxID=1209926 RepID=A0A1G4BEL4_9PEZI|nr:uncharacterized protein CORC01_04785 [Colletotrichum orchidophilum]OHE99884.1 hypothetical protein CORC01_04785 [Colletotrichum orchidophilum]